MNAEKSNLPTISCPMGEPCASGSDINSQQENKSCSHLNHAHQISFGEINYSDDAKTRTQTDGYSKALEGKEFNVQAHYDSLSDSHVRHELTSGRQTSGIFSDPNGRRILCSPLPLHQKSHCAATLPTRSPRRSFAFNPPYSAVRFPDFTESNLPSQKDSIHSSFLPEDMTNTENASLLTRNLNMSRTSPSDLQACSRLHPQLPKLRFSKNDCLEIPRLPSLLVDSRLSEKSENGQLIISHAKLPRHSSNTEKNNFWSHCLDSNPKNFKIPVSRPIIPRLSLSKDDGSSNRYNPTILHTDLSECKVRPDSLLSLLCTTAPFSQATPDSSTRLDVGNLRTQQQPAPKLGGILSEAPPFVLRALPPTKCQTNPVPLFASVLPVLVKCSMPLLSRIQSLEAKSRKTLTHKHTPLQGYREARDVQPNNHDRSRLPSKVDTISDGRCRNGEQIFRYGYPANDDDALQCLLDTPGISNENLDILKKSLLHLLTDVRKKAALFCEETRGLLGLEHMFPCNKIDERMKETVLKFCKARKAIIKKFQGYSRNRKWIENVATRQRRGCLTHRQSNVLRLWLFSNFDNPYPSTEDKEILTKETNLSLTQINNWLINARSRVWKPAVDSLSRDTIRKELIKELRGDNELANSQQNNRRRT